jgi:hypothetical protein
MINPIEATENPLVSLPQRAISEREVSPRVSSTTSQVPLADTILPMTNLTVSEYITGQGQVNTFSTSVLSLNSTHWFTRSNYANTSTITSPFDSIVSRNSVNHSYSTSGYWNWEEQEDTTFDFWIDPTSFTIDYVYSVYIQGYGYRNAMITGLENIVMSGLGTFEAWNLTIDIPGFPNFAFYEKNTGMVLCTYLEFIGDIWYNLTFAELATLPGGYMGASLDAFFPANSSILASGSLISASFSSPYGIHRLRYNWDDETDIFLSSSDFQTPIPSVDGLHNLTITVFDNIGYSTSYLLRYNTDNSLPGIILNDPQNNTKIQGSKELNFTIVSGNGTFTYNWNYSPVNASFLMNSTNTVIYVPSPQLETERILQVYIKSNITADWIRNTYSFIIDNTPPDIFIYDFVNNSVLKGSVEVSFSPSEDVNISYSLNHGLDNSYFVEAGENATLVFTNLENGTYELEITLEDEARNFFATSLRFSVYSSSFNWNWHLEAEKTQTYDFKDETGFLWFSFVIVSKSDQSFNLSLLTPSDSPSLSTDSQFGIMLLCEVPEDIIYISFTYLLPEPLLDSNQSFAVMQWVKWNDQSQEWSETVTIYNQVLHAWVTTSIGYSQYFALVETGVSTQLKSVEVGGGSIPSFELPLAIVSILVIYGIKSKRKENNGVKNVYETN